MPRLSRHMPRLRLSALLYYESAAVLRVTVSSVLANGCDHTRGDDDFLTQTNGTFVYSGKENCLKEYCFWRLEQAHMYRKLSHHVVSQHSISATLYNAYS